MTVKMDDRVLRLRVGVVVLAAALIAAFLLARFGDLPLPGAGTYTVYIRFPNAPGVTPGTPVRVSGVQIGRVSAVELMKPTGVRVTTEIDGNREILDSYVARITTASVLGDPIVEFVPPAESLATAARVEDGTEIVNGIVASNPLEVLTNLEPQMTQALVSIQRAGNEVEAAARNLNQAGGSDRLPRVAEKAEHALDQFSVAMTNVNSVFDDPEMREDLRRVLRDLPGTLTQARDTLDRANQAFDSMKQASDRASLNLQNLENFTRPLGERGPQIVDNIDGSLANINELLEQLVRVTDGLGNRQGTIGRLMYDDQLYLRLERTLMNAEDITSRMKPILDDIRVFSDKIARDPRQLGLKGALDARPIGVGTKAAPHGGHLPAGYEPIYVDPHGFEPVVVP